MGREVRDRTNLGTGTAEGLSQQGRTGRGRRVGGDDVLVREAAVWERSVTLGGALAWHQSNEMSWASLPCTCGPCAGCCWATGCGCWGGPPEGAIWGTGAIGPLPPGPSPHPLVASPEPTSSAVLLVACPVSPAQGTGGSPHLSWAPCGLHAPAGVTTRSSWPRPQS